jgi:predicted nucleotidyltransferase
MELPASALVKIETQLVQVEFGDCPARANPVPYPPSDMMTLQKLGERRTEILRLAERYRTDRVRVFGSVARGDNTDRSDVDFLVTPRPGCSLFDLGGLLEDLQDLLGCRVDLVTEDGLKPRLRERVLREAVPL